MGKEKQLETAEKLIADGKFDKALKIYNKQVAAHPEDMRLKLKLGDLFVRRKEVAQAIATYQEVASSYVSDRFHLKAIAIYKKILNLNPTLIETNENLGDLYREVGLQKDALGQYFIVADHYEQIHDTEKVLDVRMKIVDCDPSAVTSRIRLAEIFQKEGKVEDALREYEHAADDLKSQNDQEGLLEVYERIRYHKPDDLSLAVTLCRLYISRGDVNKAEKQLDSLSPQTKGQTEIKELYIDVYLRLEQRENARRLMQELFESYCEQRQSDAAMRIYGLAREEFEDDEEYIHEFDEVRTRFGITASTPAPAAPVSPVLVPITDEYLEKTTMVRLDDLPPVPESSPQPDERMHPEDLEKTTMVRLSDFPPLDEPSPESPMSPPKESGGIDLDKTVMVKADDLAPPTAPTPKSTTPEKFSGDEATDKLPEDISKKPQKSEELDETVMVDLNEFEEYLKKNKTKT